MSDDDLRAELLAARETIARCDAYERRLTAAVARLTRERDEARDLLRKVFLSADCTWEERNEGHDWAEWCQMARAFLAEAKKP
jgi:hypothetical protein